MKLKVAAPDLGPLESNVGFTIRLAHQASYQAFMEALRRFSIYPLQYTVLTLIHANPGMTQSAICEAAGIHKTNFVSILNALQRRGLTERRKNTIDRRRSELHLTARGVAFLRRVENAHRPMIEQMIARLGKRRSQQLISLLREYVGNG